MPQSGRWDFIRRLGGECNHDKRLCAKCKAKVKVKVKAKVNLRIKVKVKIRLKV